MIRAVIDRIQSSMSTLWGQTPAASQAGVNQGLPVNLGGYEFARAPQGAGQPAAQGARAGHGPRNEPRLLRAQRLEGRPLPRGRLGDHHAGRPRRRVPRRAARGRRHARRRRTRELHAVGAGLELVPGEHPAGAGRRDEAQRETLRAEIRRAADSLFDFTEMSRRALGRHWTDRTAAERGEGLGEVVSVLLPTRFGDDERRLGRRLSGACAARFPLRGGSTHRAFRGTLPSGEPRGTGAMPCARADLRERQRRTRRSR